MLCLILALALEAPGVPQDASRAVMAPNPVPVPLEKPGTKLELVNYEGHAAVTVTVESVTPGPVPWVDAAGGRHNERTVIFVLPGRGRLVTTWPALLGHLKRPTPPLINLRDVPFAGGLLELGPPPPGPRSNQAIKDGIARPRDTLLEAPLTNDYYDARSKNR